MTNLPSSKQAEGWRSLAGKSSPQGGQAWPCTFPWQEGRDSVTQQCSREELSSGTLLPVSATGTEQKRASKARDLKTTERDHKHSG